MTSHHNYSHKDRAYRDSDTFERPELFETNNKVNEMALHGFEKHKDRWREILSYYRLNKIIIII